MKKIYQSLFASAALIALSAGVPAFAQVGVGLGASVSGSANVGGNGAGISAKVGADVQLKVQKGQEFADKEIDRRVTALNTWAARVSAAQKLSADEKSSLTASLQNQLSAMATLKAQIAADAAAEATSSLRADIKSITGSYRIFALVLPQTTITVAADREMTIVGTMNGLGTKLQARIAAAQSAGKNTTAAAAALADFNAKVSDANVQAQAAVSETAKLTPDQGDQTKFQANTTALKDGQAKIKTSQQDLATARTDAETVVKALASFKASVNSTTSAAAGAAY